MTADQQTALWIAHPVLQLAVAAAMFRCKLHRAFPVFFAYICFQILAFCFLFPMSSQWVSASYTVFFWSYWACAAVNLVLGFMVIYEIFLDVFRPYYTLKDLGSVLFKWAALVMSLVAFVVAASSPTGDQGPIVEAVITVTRCVRVAQVGLVLFLLVFSRYLGVSWKQHSFGLSMGLGLSAGVELGTLAFPCEWPRVRQFGACDQSRGLQRYHPGVARLFPGEERSASARSGAVYLAPLGERPFRHSESGAG